MDWETVDPDGLGMDGLAASIPNCSCRSPPGEVNVFNAVVIIGFLPLLSAFGLAANIVNMWIYSKSNTSAERYLMSLSISDFGICLSGILVIAADSLRPHSFFIDQAFVVLLPKLIPFGLFFQTTSIYITVFAAIDCYVNISRCLPARSRDFCTVRAANRVLVGVFVASASLQRAVQCYAEELDRELLELCPTEMRVNEDYITIYKGVLYVFFMAFFPFVLLCLLTTLIVWELQRNKSRAIRGQLRAAFYTAINVHHETPKEEEAEGGSPIVLVLVVVLFLCCNLVSLIVNLAEMAGEGALSPEMQSLLIDVGNVLVVSNASANIAIYCYGSISFRQQALDLMGFGRREKITRTSL
ncbi:G-PROTEIN-RECEP-F1-2 domain-containing protein [Aphelenchoides fujianensis]|nr:G-PROTEIN-RECEP-F1-2 domain-containing protein [Aphelenchoides fujianensis]